MQPTTNTGRCGMDRREFIRRSALIAAASACSSVIRTSWGAFTPKRILVFGGTDFVGPALVEALLVDGHKVTILNRGATNPETVTARGEAAGISKSGSKRSGFVRGGASAFRRRGGCMAE